MGKLLLNGREYGGSVETALSDLTDVNLSSPADGQTLRYNGTSGKWENGDTDISPFSVVNGAVNITYTTS